MHDTCTCAIKKIFTKQMLTNYRHSFHPAWKHHKLALFITAQDREALQQLIKAQNITDTIYSTSVTSVKWDVCTEPKETSPTQPQCVHPAAIRQHIQKYLLLYH